MVDSIFSFQIGKYIFVFGKCESVKLEVKESEEEL